MCKTYFGTVLGRTFALVAALQALSGCATFDIWAGYYFPSARDPNQPVEGEPELKLDASWGLGLGASVFYDHDQKFRVGVNGGFEAILLSGEGVSSDLAYTAVPLGARFDYSVTDGDTKLMASAAAAIGSGEALSTPINVTSAWLGATAAVYESRDDYDAILLSLGLRYISGSQKGETPGERGITMTGPEIRISVPVGLISAESGGGSGGGGGGGGEGDGGNAGWKVTLPDSSPITPALATGMRRKGCSIVKQSSNVVVGECWNGRIAYVQQGSQLLIVCDAGVSRSACREMNEGIAQAAAR